MSSTQHPAEIRRLPFPFPDGKFPAELGAVIQRTVLEGREPAREILHSADNSWTVGDGLNDPNEPGTCAASHMQHVLARNSSMAALASLPLGHRAGLYLVVLGPVMMGDQALSCGVVFVETEMGWGYGKRPEGLSGREPPKFGNHDLDHEPPARFGGSDELYLWWTAQR